MAGYFQRQWKDNGDIETVNEQTVRNALKGNYFDIDILIKYLKDERNTRVNTPFAWYSYILNCPETKENKIV